MIRIMLYWKTVIDVLQNKQQNLMTLRDEVLLDSVTRGRYAHPRNTGFYLHKQFMKLTEIDLWPSANQIKTYSL